MKNFLIAANTSIARMRTFSGVEAHISMPSEVMPRILAGLRLHMKTAIRSIISSIGTCFTNPLTIVRVLPSPTSTSSTYRESASGCFLTVSESLEPESN